MHGATIKITTNYLFKCDVINQFRQYHSTYRVVGLQRGLLPSGLNNTFCTRLINSMGVSSFIEKEESGRMMECVCVCFN